MPQTDRGAVIPVLKILAPVEPALVLRAQQGDLDARDRLLEETYRRVFRYHLRLTRGDRNAAADLAQETIVRLLESLRDLRKPERFLPWSLRIATNLWRDRFRARRGFAEARVAPADRRAEGGDAVRELDALPEPYRAALSLRYLQGLDYETMAEILDVPAATLRSHVARGLRMIREKMDGEVTP